MASLVDILRIKWPGKKWALRDDDTGDTYAKLDWLDVAPKPSEAEIRAFSDEVDADLAGQSAKDAAAARFFLANPDAVLRGFEITSDCIAAIYSVLTGTQKTTIANIAGDPIDKFRTLQAHLAAMRSGS